VVVRHHRREADTAMPHHHSADAILARRRQQRVPHDLAVEVGMDIDPARRDQPVAGVDLFATAAHRAANGADAPLIDGYIAGKSGSAGAVDNRSVADDQIVHDETLVLCLIRGALRPACEACYF
jgi:hypothetical protein